MQAAKQIDAIFGLSAKKDQTENGEFNAPDLKKFKRAMGTMQHHDAVTGTEKQAVAEDYASNDALFLENFEQAWTTLANADRFDGPFGNVCDTEDENDNGYGNTLHRLNILTFIITLFLLY